MLNRPEPFKIDSSIHPFEREGLDLSDIVSFLFRNRYIVLGTVAGGLLLSIGYLLVTPVRFAATAQVIIDPNRLHVVQSTGVADGPLDASTVESQVAIIKSGGVVQTVIRNLNLTADQEFDPTRSGLLQTGLGWVFGERPEPTDEEKLLVTVERVQRALTVARAGISYVINIEFLAENRIKAAEIANAVAETYRSKQIEARNDRVRGANIWLEERLAVIRSETLLAEKALQDFKAQSKTNNSSATYVDLESHALSQRRVYENFLQRHLETSQQLSFPGVEARVITQATPPLRKTEPKTLLSLLAGLTFGLSAGVIGAFLRERLIG